MNRHLVGQHEPEIQSEDFFRSLSERVWHAVQAPSGAADFNASGSCRPPKEFVGLRIFEFRLSDLQICRFSNLQVSDAQIVRFSDCQILRFPHLQIFRFPVFRSSNSRFSSFQVSRFSDFQI